MLKRERCNEIIREILTGNPDAYSEIIAGYQDSVRAALGGYCRSPQELEDFCHKAFVETYFKLSEYDPKRGAFLPWFLTIARNCLLEDLRRRKAEERRLHRYIERTAFEESPFEDAEIARQALERCLADVDASEARIIRARYREGRSCEQIASNLGKTATATRKLLQRLRERLRTCVERRLTAVPGTRT